MYKALIAFTDLADGKYRYKAGDTYPRAGYTPTEKRIKELSTTENKLGEPVIEYIESEKPVEIPAEIPETDDNPVEVVPEPKKRRRKNA